MQFKCRKCGHQKEVHEKLMGKSVKCPNCDTLGKIMPEPVRFKEVGEPVPVVPTAVRQSSGQSSGQISSSGLPMGDSETKTPQGMRPVTEYQVNRNPLGNHVSYACPYCREKLTNGLADAGGMDRCPNCKRSFIVPGEKEYQEEISQRQQADANRRAQKEQVTEATKRAVVNKVAQAGLKDRNVQLDRDPLMEWLIYFAVMAVLVVLAAGQYMVTAVIYDTSHLCLVIFALFLVGLGLNFRSILHLRNEYVCAAVCMMNLGRPNGMTMVTQGPAAGVLQQHIMNLNAIAKHDESFTQDSLITLLYSRMMARSKMVDILGGVLVTLGLIGTIVGLISMTDGLSVTLSSLDSKEQSADLLSGMRSTMSGLGTAFNTTLVGAILGSVVLRILNNVYTSNVDHLVTYVATTAEVSIVPRLKVSARKSEVLL